MKCIQTFNFLWFQYFVPCERCGGRLKNKMSGANIRPLQHCWPVIFRNDVREELSIRLSGLVLVISFFFMLSNPVSFWNEYYFLIFPWQNEWIQHREGFTMGEQQRGKGSKVWAGGKGRTNSHCCSNFWCAKLLGSSKKNWYLEGQNNKLPRRNIQKVWSSG